MITNKNTTSWDAHLDKKYGKRGTDKREEFQEDFEAFKIGALIQEARKSKNLTQQQLAQQKITSPELKTMRATSDFQHSCELFVKDWMEP